MPLTHEERAERRRKMARAVKAGRAPADVASEFDVSLSTVYSACKEHKVPIEGPGPGRPPSKELLERNRKIALAVERGQNPVDIAKEYGVSVGLVYWACKQNGVARPIQPTSHNDIADSTLQVIAGLISGETYEEIGQRHGITRQRVHLIASRARKAGILQAAQAPRTLNIGPRNLPLLRIVAALLQGKKRASIAEEFDVSINLVSKTASLAEKAGVFSAAGVRRETLEQQAHAIRRRKIAASLRAGKKTMKQIAEEQGVSVATVARVSKVVKEKRSIE